MITWTDNPYVDVGLATILALRNKDDPAQLTTDDLEAVADYIVREYLRDPLKSFLTVAFTSNAWFAQPSFTPEKRTERGRLHVTGWRSTAMSNERCIFTGQPVTALALSDKLTAGRAARAQIPLTQGDENINFFPNGDAGLPISGEALLCLQAFPLGCAKVQGRLLAVHASDPRLTLAFAQRFLRENEKGVQLARESGSTKLRETPFTLGTALAMTLMDILHNSAYMLEEDTPTPSLTAYHLTNAQTPEIAIYYLPLGVMRFLGRALGAGYRRQWQRLVDAAWQREASKPAKRRGRKTGASKESDQPAPSQSDRPRRNYLLDDLLKLPDDAARFLRVYFLRRAARQARSSDEDPRTEYSTLAQLDLISWELTRLFLLEVMNMDQTRIEHIRRLGDGLATYVHAENDRRFFRAFFGEMNYSLFRNRLIKADAEWVKRGNPPLITFEQFIEVFEEGDEIARRDWRLARDLVLIRMIEQLHANGWLAQNRDALPEEAPAEAATGAIEDTEAEAEIE